MAAPDEEEKNVLIQFRNEISKMNIVLDEYSQRDIGLLTWLRARELNVKAASEMLKKSLEWRQINDIDNILNWIPPIEYHTKFPYSLEGRDKDGRTIMILPFGIWDIKSEISSGRRDLWLRYMTQVFEKIQSSLKKSSEDTRTEISQFVIISDVDKFSYKQLSSFTNIDTVMEMVRIMEGNYPEIVYRCYVINTSWVFTMLYEIVKKFITKRTADKMQMYTTPEKWKPIFTTQLPLDQLPIKYGGTADELINS